MTRLETTTGAKIDIEVIFKVHDPYEVLEEIQKSKPFNHGFWTHRTRDYVFKIEDSKLLAVGYVHSGFKRGSALYYACKACLGAGKIRVLNPGPNEDLDNFAGVPAVVACPACNDVNSN